MATIETAASPLRRFIEAMGYPAGLIAEDYPTWPAQVLTSVPIVAFGSAPFDMSNATVVGARLDRSAGIGREIVFDATRTLSALASVIMVDDRSIELWWLGQPDQPVRVASHIIGTAPARLELANRFGPRSLLAVKRGAIQLPLFPIDVALLDRARRMAGLRLADIVSHTVFTVREQLAEEKLSTADTNVTKIVISALTLAFIRDRFDLSMGSPEWHEYLSQAHPHLYDWLTSRDYGTSEAISTSVRLLSSSANFKSLDPSLVSTIYESTLLPPEARADLGVFYTPSELATRMVANLPIEEIAPDDRYVVDPTCGSGTLLLAAHQRIRSLLSKKVDRGEAHSFAVNHIAGFDTDPLAIEVARLCLTLSSLPDGNGWNLTARDALTADLRLSNRRPALIVSNPPWKSVRSDTKGRRVEKATEFLAWSIRNLREGGLLGIVLPAGWLTARHAEKSRELLRETCRVLEIWRLPERTFAEGEIAPAVLLARRRPEGRKPYVERRLLGTASLSRFYSRGYADEVSMVFEGPSASKRAPFVGTPLTGPAAERIWSKSLENVARIRSGPPRHRGARKGVGDFLLADRLSRTKYFSVVRENDCTPVRFPEDFDSRAAGSVEDYLSKKILMSGKLRPDNPWAARVRLDLLGVIPPDGYYMIIPSENNDHYEDSLYALIALLGSTFVCAWLDERRATRNIPSTVLRGLPVPDEWLSLGHFGRRLTEASGDASRLESILHALDEEVFALYRLSEKEISAIKAHFSDRAGPDGVVRFTGQQPHQKPPGPDAIYTFGSVLEANADGLRIWVPGVTEEEGDLTRIPSRLPGALLDPGSTFNVLAEPGEISDAVFEYHASSWRSHEIGISETGDQMDQSERLGTP